MGKYENMMKCAQVRSLVNEKQYRNAYDIVQTLNIDQITAITDLNTIADVYIQLQKYVEAKDVYLRLYERLSTRRVLYQLVYLSVKCGEIEEAEDYFEEYKKLDKSVDRIILRYYIDKAKGVDKKTLIGYLQQLKKEDYIEEWAYELAKLYHKEGMESECIEECSDIILWFGEGLIVEKAMLLKHHYIDGADISSEKAIMRETKNLAAELKIAAAIAAKNEREKAMREAAAQKETKKSFAKELVQGSEKQFMEEPVPQPEKPFIGESIQEPKKPFTGESIQEPKKPFIEKSIQEPKKPFIEKSIQEPEKSFIEKSIQEPEKQVIEQKKVEQTTSKMTAKEELQQALARLYGGIRSIAEPYNEETYSEKEYEEKYSGESLTEEGNGENKPEEIQTNEEDRELYKSETQIKEPYIENKNKVVISIEENDSMDRLQKEIIKIVRDIKNAKNLPHIAIMGDTYEKNVELGKNFARELYRQKVLPTSKIARINAGKLSNVNLQDNRHKLLGGCLLVEEAGIMSLDSIQNLYQFMNRSKGRVIVIFSDTKEKMEDLLKKNRKLESLVEYHIQI